MKSDSAQQENSSSGYVRLRLGSPEHRGTGMSEMRLIAAVNESIKQSIAASESISLIAVNANLVAGRSGTRAAGYCVVASELRRFSDRMAGMMQGWSGLIYALVKETACSRNVARRLYKLQATGRLSGKAQAAIAATCERSLRELNVLTTRNSARVIDLQNMISRAEKQHMTGIVIARSAMIEAAYGGEMQSVLRQIAQRIDEAIAKFSEYSRNVGHLIHKASA